jgi:hypothetical protein
MGMPSWVGRPGFFGVGMEAILFRDRHVTLFRDYHENNQKCKALGGGASTLIIVVWESTWTPVIMAKSESCYAPSTVV